MGISARNRTLEGIPVVDAKKPRKITVLDKDVTRRGRKRPEGCAAALACLRLPDVAEARVYLTRTFLKIGGKWVRHMTPSSIRQEAISYDRGGTFEVGEHTLGAVYPSARQIAHKKRKGRVEPTNSKRRVKKYHMTVGVRERAPLV